MDGANVSVRDIVSSVIFYAGMILLSLLLLRVGTRYSMEKVHEDFRGMEPRLQRGSHIFLNKTLRQPDQLSYDDIIMYKRPAWKRASYAYELARVLGKPGDLVEMRDRRLYRAERRDGKLGPLQLVNEPYVDPRDIPTDFSAFAVPRNTIFVMQDDRDRRESLRNLLVPVRSIAGRMIR